MPKPSKKGKGKKPPPPPSSSSSDGESDSDDERSYEDAPRAWGDNERAQNIEQQRESGALQQLKDQALDDLSSDDEDAGNATGRVPTHWYEGYDHIGYDVSGSKVVPEKPLDGLDLAIEADDGEGVTVYDKLNGRNVRISKRELEQIRRLKKGAFANPETEMYPDTFRSSVIEHTPLHNAPEPKRRFIPSKWEGMRIHRLAQGLADGRLRTREENRRLRKEARDPERRFLEAAATMWGPEDVEDPSGRRKGPLPVPAPKLKLPGHEESYRPPAEYCVDDEGQPLTEPEEGQDFVPKQHDSLRRVGVYEKGVQERFERCLDLYLCPRKLKRRLAIDPESLVPKLPDPRDLKPFPNALCRSFIGHTTAVVALDCSQDGQWLARISVLIIEARIWSRRGYPSVADRRRLSAR